MAVISPSGVEYQHRYDAVLDFRHTFRSSRPKSACKQLELRSVTRLWTLSLRSLSSASGAASRLSPTPLALGSCSLWLAQWWHPLDRRGPIKRLGFSLYRPLGPAAPRSAL